MKTGTIRIGTSGWMYKEWGKKFYPEGLAKGHLDFYTSFNNDRHAYEIKDVLFLKKAVQ